MYFPMQVKKKSRTIYGTAWVIYAMKDNKKRTKLYNTDFTINVIRKQLDGLQET